MRKFLEKFGIYLVAFLVCFWAAALMASIFTIPIRFICGESVLAERILMTVVSLICAFAFLFFTAFIEGFRVRSVNLKTLLPIVLIVLVIHHLVSLYFNYAYTFCGPVGFVCEAIYFGDAPAIGENELRLGWYPIWWDAVVLTVFQFTVYAPAVLVGEICGVKARFRGIEKMKKKSDDNFS